MFILIAFYKCFYFNVPDPTRENGTLCDALRTGYNALQRAHGSDMEYIPSLKFLFRQDLINLSMYCIVHGRVPPSTSRVPLKLLSKWPHCIKLGVPLRSLKHHPFKKKYVTRFFTTNSYVIITYVTYFQNSFCKCLGAHHLIFSWLWSIYF